MELLFPHLWWCHNGWASNSSIVGDTSYAASTTQKQENKNKKQKSHLYSFKQLQVHGMLHIMAKNNLWQMFVLIKVRVPGFCIYLNTKWICNRVQLQLQCKIFVFDSIHQIRKTKVKPNHPEASVYLWHFS